MAGVRVRLLGRPAVEAADGSPPAHPRGRKTWALLARIALADRPVGRGELAETLFPEADDPLAALRW
ncbi:MAG: transcriptional regulator, family, partial [Amnibacterium sp.]|nr:transcriptional regulator, family [Amnibacterium sp.]